MALIECPECNSRVSDTALKCQTCGFQIKKYERSFFGKLIKWSFIAFNIVMAIWLFSYWGQFDTSAYSDTAGKAGFVVGYTIGSGLLLGLWVIGDIILGLFVLFTKPSS